MYVKCQATTCILHFTKVNVNNGEWVQEDWNIGGRMKFKLMDGCTKICQGVSRFLV